MAIFVALAVVSVVLAVQASARVYLMLYGWGKRTPGKPQSSVPATPPSHGFTILLPAWQESGVIAQTIDKIAALDYPASLYELLVICDQSDTPTIEAARRALSGYPNITSQVVLLTHGPRSKATGLNRGLECSNHEIVVIVDAEDDVHPGILRAANSAYDSLDVDIVQGPVQLINQGSRWYSQLNCLEYYFWFHSRLIFHAERNVIPLAGNTVFFRRSALDALGGWDATCLTEDADVGIRASVLGLKTAILADPQLATREETPGGIGGLLRQRTRWHQGFLQILRKGDWLKLPTLRGRFIAFATLSFPLYAAMTSLIWPLSIPLYFLLRGPVWLVLVAAIPYYLLLAQMLFSAFGLVALRHQFRLKLGPKQVAYFLVGFMPYQWLIGLCGIRALVRELAGQGGWEKTEHVGSHRPALPAPDGSALVPVPVPVLTSETSVRPVAGGSNGHAPVDGPSLHHATNGSNGHVPGDTAVEGGPAVIPNGPGNGSNGAHSTNGSGKKRAERIASVVEFLGAVNAAGSDSVEYLTQLNGLSSARPNGGTPEGEDAFLSSGNVHPRAVQSPHEEE